MTTLLFLLLQAGLSMPAGKCTLATQEHRHLNAIDDDPNQLQSVNCFGNLMTTINAGGTWQVHRAHCTNRTLQFWRNGTAARSCLLWRNEGSLNAPVTEEHTCTSDGGVTWHKVMDFVAMGEHVVDVTAVPGRPETLLAVWMKHSGTSLAPQLISSEDGGEHWHDVAAYVAAYNVQIVEVFKDGSALLLTGDTPAGFSQLVRLNPAHTRIQQVSGPWQHPGTSITQAVVNPLDRRQWLVSSWRPAEGIDRTHITFSAGVTFIEQPMPKRADWPVEFVDNHGTLIANLRQPLSDTLSAHQAAIYRPAKKAWVVFTLPEHSDTALVRGGRIFAMGAFKLKGAEATGEDLSRWHEVGNMCPF